MSERKVMAEFSTAGELIGTYPVCDVLEKQEALRRVQEMIAAAFDSGERLEGLFFAISTAGVEKVVCYAKDEKIRERCARDGRKMLWSLIPGSTAWQKGEDDERG